MGFGDSSAITIVINAIDNFSKTFSKANIAMKKFAPAGIAAGVAGAAIAVGLKKAVDVSRSFESAFAGVKKTVELTDSEFVELEKNFKTLTTEIPKTFEELSSIGEIAGQLGVEGVDNITKFTKTIADISVTTNLTAEEAATSFARIANVMGEPIDNVDRMGAAVVDLGNNFATSESEIVAMSTRIVGAGKTIGLTTQEVFGMSTAMSSLGIRSEMGGSAISRTMITIAKAVSKGGEDVEKFAEVSGMTVEEFSEKWKSKPVDAMSAVVMGLKNTTEAGGNTFGILEDLDLSSIRITDTMLRLAGSEDGISKAVEMSNKAWEDNTALVEEAEKRYGTLDSQIEIATNQFRLIGDEIGDRLAPYIEILLGYLQKMIDWWNGLSEKMKTTIVLIAAATAVILLLAGAIALVNLIASPWLLIILAVAAAVAAIILVVRHWGEIMEWLKEKTKPFFDFLKIWFAPQIALVKLAIELLGWAFEWLWEHKLKPMWENFKKVWAWLKDFFTPVVEKAVELINKAIDKYKAFKQSVGAGIDVVTNFVSEKRKSSQSVNDAIITPKGIVHTNPNDYLIATKNPGALGGGGVTLVIEGNVYGTDPDEIATALFDKLKLKTNV